MQPAARLGVEELRIGLGEDAHALVAGRPLILGAVPVPDSVRGPVARSDGDALLHAVADAMLSALALGDIGVLFPPGAKASLGVDSSAIVAKVLATIEDRAGPFAIVNLAAVVTLDAPELTRYRVRMAESVAHLLGARQDAVGLSFKTSEGLAPDHLQARACVLLRLLGRGPRGISQGNGPL